MQLGLQTVSSLERCLSFRVSFVGRFHCIGVNSFETKFSEIKLCCDALKLYSTSTVFLHFVLSPVDLYGFKPLEDEDVSISFSHVFQRLGVSVDEDVDLQMRVERQVALVREWAKFLQAHGSADGALPNSVS